jgi:hypothetical protein
MPDFIRDTVDRLKSFWDGFSDRFTSPFRRDASAAPADTTDKLRLIGGVVAAFAAILLVYYPVGMALYHTIDDDVNLQPAAQYSVPNGSRAISMAVTLIHQQADYWAPNKPFWMPASALDNMPNYQSGMMYSLSRFAVELGDYLGRVRGSSSIDPNLDLAAGLLKYDPTTWYWGQGNILPMPTAESRYLQAADALMRYNSAVSTGQSTYDRRSDNLIAFLDRVAADLGSASASLDVHVSKAGGGYFDRDADDVFYNVKGRLFGYHMILRELGVDFEAVIAQKQATGIWNNMLESLRKAATMDPLIVANGEPGGLFVPSHLSELGFDLLRARTQIREATDSLQK